MRYLRNFIVTALLVLSLAVIVSAAQAASWHVMWDPYNDQEADGIRVYRSTDLTFTTATTSADLPKDANGNFPTSYDLGSGPGDDIREYYRATAYYTDDQNAQQESPPSETVSLYWTSGGGGTLTPQGPGGLKLVDCDNLDDPDHSLCPGQ